MGHWCRRRVRPRAGQSIPCGVGQPTLKGGCLDRGRRWIKFLSFDTETLQPAEGFATLAATINQGPRPLARAEVQ